MKLIIGLGNPGEKYKNNRHNVGYIVIDSLTGKVKNTKLFKSDKFMNDSGNSVKKLTDKYLSATKDLYVVHDDLDIRLGEYKIQFAKGPKVHNGLNDIYDKLGTNEFWHIRMGVDNREPDNRTPGEEYVLMDFTKEEQNILSKVIEQIVNQFRRM